MSEWLSGFWLESLGRGKRIDGKRIGEVWKENWGGVERGLRWCGKRIEVVWKEDWGGVERELRWCVGNCLSKGR